MEGHGIIANDGREPIYTMPGIMVMHSDTAPALSQETLQHHAYTLLTSHTDWQYNPTWNTPKGPFESIPKEAIERAEKLVKEWLSPMEYSYLLELCRSFHILYGQEVCDDKAFFGSVLVFFPFDYSHVFFFLFLVVSILHLYQLMFSTATYYLY
jgi:hypothetical protein